MTARDHYIALGTSWLEEFNVRHVEVRHRRSFATGCAWAERREIAAPPPTTPIRLAVVAHEIGHVVLDHRGRQPNYVQEFAAEMFSLALLARDDVPVGAYTVESKQLYVWEHISTDMGWLGWIDPEIAAWAARWCEGAGLTGWLTGKIAHHNAGVPVAAWTDHYTFALEAIRRAGLAVPG